MDIVIASIHPEWQPYNFYNIRYSFETALSILRKVMLVTYV